ncbi:MAG: HTH-type transcriptional regulator RutR [Burkholderiaceae bacterium]|nr:HTH-type transcriptional regulator RutR [Burkholderiaceae bacterium]
MAPPWGEEINMSIDTKPAPAARNGTRAPERAAAPRRKAEAAATARKPRSRAPRVPVDKRGVILSAALGLFSRFGLHGTTVDQVAARAGVSKSNLLYHFANKEELYVATLRDLLDVWLEPLRAFRADQDPREAIADYIRAKLALSRDRPDASRLFCLEMIQGAPLLRDDLARELRELVATKSAVIRAWVSAGRLAPVAPHHLVFALWATTQHYADFAVQIQAITGRTLDDPAFFEEAVANVQRIVLDGVTVQAAGTQAMAALGATAGAPAPARRRASAAKA